MKKKIIIILIKDKNWFNDTHISNNTDTFTIYSLNLKRRSSQINKIIQAREHSLRLENQREGGGVS